MFSGVGLALFKQTLGNLIAGALFSCSWLLEESQDFLLDSFDWIGHV
jgi:hypothetical protein